MYTKRRIVVVAIVLFAGVTGLVVDEFGSAGDSSTDGVTTVNAQPATETPSPTASPTSTATPAASSELSDDTASPWETAVVEVSINNSAYPHRNVTESALWAIEYWNANLQAYTDWNFRFTLVDQADSDVELQVLASHVSCDGDAVGTVGTDTSPGYGCSSVASRDVAGETTIQLAGFQSEASMRLVIRHELGHVIGLNHTTEPHEVMGTPVVEEDVQNATDRYNPWPTETITITVDNASYADDRDMEAVHAEARYATAFFQQGAAGTTPNVTYQYNASAAVNRSEIVLRGPEYADCTVDGDASIGRIHGVQRDSDASLEQHTKVNICTRGLDNKVLSWHVAYWIGSGMGLTAEELPDQLQREDYDDRSGQWHGS